MACGSDSFCGGGVSRPDAVDTGIGKQFVDLLGKSDKRTQEIFNMIQPLLTTASGQASDVLQGGVGPMAPAVQAATGSAQQALSQSMMQNREDWNRQGITGTDYARLNADQLRQGGQQISGIPSQFTQPLLTQIFAALTGSQAQAVQSQQGGLSTAGGVTSAQIQPIKGSTIASYAPQVAGSGPSGG